MNQTEILQRAWKILWNYKTLWIFGFLLALTSGGGTGSRGNYSIPSTSPGSYDIRDLGKYFPKSNEFGTLLESTISGEIWQAIALVALCLICLALVFMIIFGILRYVSRTALIRMVDQFEENGEKVNLRAGFRLGWSRRAVRLFLIDLLVSLPILVAVLCLFGFAFLPLILSMIGDGEPSIFGIVSTVGIFLILLMLAVILGVAIDLFLQIIWRVNVLDDKGVIGSIQAGWVTTIQHFKDVFLLWVILLAVQIAWIFVMIPVVILLIGIGFVLGGGLGGGLYLLGRGISEQIGWILAAVLGGMVFLAILSVPVLFLNGLKETYLSATWTLAYRSFATPGKSDQKELDES